MRVGTAGLAGTTPLSRVAPWDYLSPPARAGADPNRVQRVRAIRAGFFMTTFLDNWKNSNYWDVQLPEPQGDGEAVASDASRPRPASAERLPSKPEPLALCAGALLTLLGISVRYIKTPAEALQVVVSLVDVVNHFGLDVETAKLTPYAHLGQAGLNPHLSRPRLVQLYPGGPEVFVFDLFAVPMLVLRPLLEKQFVAHNAIFDLGHLMHAGLEPERIDCTMLQANALTGKRPSLAALTETELGWQISKEQQVSDWSASILSQKQIEYAALRSEEHTSELQS